MALRRRSPSTAGRFPRGRLTANSYLTDGRRLFRCLPAERGSMLMLEDCQSLDLILCEESDLLKANLRLVKAGELDDGAVAQLSAAVPA